MADGKKVLVVTTSAAIYLNSPCITVCVGEGNVRSFSVHQDLITSRSPFFAKMLSGDWKETEDGVVKLPEDDPVIFALYIQTLYTGKIPLKEATKPHDQAEEKTVDRAPRKEPRQSEAKAAKAEFTMLGYLYVLCEKIQDTVAKNLIVDAFIEATFQIRDGNSNYYPLRRVINVIYEGTLKSSPMRALLADMYAMAADPSWWDQSDRVELSADFIFDVVVCMTKERKIPQDRSRIRISSNYYEKTEKEDGANRS